MVVIMEEIKRIERRLVSRGAIFDYYQDTMELPNGHHVTFDHIEHKGAASVVPVLEDGRIVMVRQYRNSIEKYTWEIPAGGLNDREEPPVEAARRELEEETGYTTALELEYLITVHSCVAYDNEKVEVYVARQLKPGMQHLDEEEFLDVKAFSPEEIKAMIYAGELTDSKTIAAIMSYCEKYLR